MWPKLQFQNTLIMRNERNHCSGSIREAVSLHSELLLDFQEPKQTVAVIPVAFEVGVFVTGAENSNLIGI